MLVASLRPTCEAADRVRRHADLLGDESDKVERHYLAFDFSAASRARFAAALAATSASLKGNGPCSIAALAAGPSVPSACSLGSASRRIKLGAEPLSCAGACAANAKNENAATKVGFAKRLVALHINVLRKHIQSRFVIIPSPHPSDRRTRTVIAEPPDARSEFAADVRSRRSRPSARRLARR